VVLGAGGLWYATQTGNAPVTVAITPLAPTRIFVDDRQQVTGTGAALAQAIQASVARPLAAGAVRLLSVANGTSTGASVFSALQEPAPDILLRNINAATSMAGVINASANQSPFFIIGVLSYGDTFAGMLQWESRMAYDLSALYPAYPAIVVPVAPVATTTTKGKAPASPTPAPFIATPVFRDEVVANHDARALNDLSGRTLIIYGYWDAHTLILARDEAAFAEIISRLANSRTSQ
jgi:hypothetical protein